MQSSERARAVAAATSVASRLGLSARDAIVLNDSNKLTVRLLPCDVVARVAPASHEGAAFEIDIAQRLAAVGCPVAAPEPRVGPRSYDHGGFIVSLWTYYAPATTSEISPVEYAAALQRLHLGMRLVDLPAPHFTDRVDSALQLLADRERTPSLADDDRELLVRVLTRLTQDVGRSGNEQLLHGEPHPGNLLSSPGGPVFIDFETCCRGPIEFDLAHAPEEVSGHYPGIDPERLRQCRILMLAMIITWRWDLDDQLPNGARLALEWTDQLRAMLHTGA